MSQTDHGPSPDGPECPYAYTYTTREAALVFTQFRSTDTKVAHFPLSKYPGGRLMPRTVERLVAGSVGRHLLIRATK